MVVVSSLTLGNIYDFISFIILVQKQRITSKFTATYYTYIHFFFQLVIAFESGLVVVWDLRARLAEWRGSLGTGGPGDAVRAAAWQHDGKLMTAHADGALATWSMRAPRPTSLSYPHGKTLHI